MHTGAAMSAAGAVQGRAPRKWQRRRAADRSSGGSAAAAVGMELPLSLPCLSCFTALWARVALLLEALAGLPAALESDLSLCSVPPRPPGCALPAGRTALAPILGAERCTAARRPTVASQPAAAAAAPPRRGDRRPAMWDLEQEQDPCSLRCNGCWNDCDPKEHTVGRRGAVPAAARADDRSCLRRPSAAARPHRRFPLTPPRRLPRSAGTSSACPASRRSWRATTRPAPSARKCVERHGLKSAPVPAPLPSPFASQGHPWCPTPP